MWKEGVSRPIFRAARMRKTLSRGPNFVRFVRERLLSKLYGGQRAKPEGATTSAKRISGSANPPDVQAGPALSQVPYFVL